MHGSPRTAAGSPDGCRSGAITALKRGTMFKILDQIPYPVLIVVAVFMLLAPFRPQPHVLEKLMMLKAGNLTRPIDIFDLFYHLLPLFLLLIKVWKDHVK